MIPADIWPCGFFAIISLAPSTIARPVDSAWTPAINIKIINPGVCKSISILRSEQVEKLVLGIPTFNRRTISIVG